jgi:2-haloacid dehalogenase
MNIDDIKATVKACMFDQYGTVADMQSGLTAIAAPFLRAKGWSGDANSFVMVASHAFRELDDRFLAAP